MPMSLRGTCLGAVLSVAAAPVHAEVLFHETFGTGRCDARDSFESN